MNIRKLLGWIPNIAPLVYDDSLSFLELLGRVVGKTNEIIDAVNSVEQPSVSATVTIGDETDVETVPTSDGYILNFTFDEDLFEGGGSGGGGGDDPDPPTPPAVQSEVEVFNNVAAMVDSNLSDNACVITLGYYTPGDGGGAGYVITSTQPTTWYETLSNGKFAKLAYKGEVNVKQFGAKGDGSTDDTEAIQAALDAMYYATGGTVRLPKGQYNIGTYVIVGSNVRFIGEGRESYVYLYNEDGATVKLGVPIGVCGSNVEVSNMRIEYLNTRGAIAMGSANGCIGATTYSYEDAKAANWNGTKYNYHDLIFTNLYSDSNYMIQVEPYWGSDITNVTIRDIYAPNSMNSLWIGSSQGTYANIKNVTIENVRCAFIRLYDNSAASHIDNVFINNCLCQYMLIGGGAITINNVVIDQTKPSAFDGSNMPFTGAISLYSRNNETIAYMSNVTLFGSRATTNKSTVGILFNGSGSWFFSNVKAKNFYTKNFQGAAAAPSNFANCDFTDGFNAESSLVGHAVNTLCNNIVPTMLNAVFIDTPLTITRYNGAVELSNNAPNTAYLNGNVVTFNLGIAVSSGLQYNTNYAQVQIAPYTTRYCAGFIGAGDNAIPVICKIDNNGYVSISYAYGAADLGGRTQLSLNGFYTVQ